MPITIESLETILSEQLQEALSVGLPYSISHQLIAQYLTEVARTRAIAEALAKLKTLTLEDINNTVIAEGTTVLQLVQQVVANEL